MLQMLFFSKSFLIHVGEKRNSVANTTVAELQQPVSNTANCNSSSSSSSGSQGRTPRHSLTSNDGEQDTRQIRPSSLWVWQSSSEYKTDVESLEVKELHVHYIFWYHSVINDCF